MDSGLIIGALALFTIGGTLVSWDAMFGTKWAEVRASLDSHRR